MYGLHWKLEPRRRNAGFTFAESVISTVGLYGDFFSNSNSQWEENGLTRKKRVKLWAFSEVAKWITLLDWHVLAIGQDFDNGS